jgi:hypothetical protein
LICWMEVGGYIGRDCLIGKILIMDDDVMRRYQATGICEGFNFGCRVIKYTPAMVIIVAIISRMASVSLPNIMATPEAITG